MLPREHGAWAIVLAPLLVGLVAAPSFSPVAALLFLIGALAAFVLRAPVQALWIRPDDLRARRWAAAYAILASAGLAPLIFGLGRWSLLWFAVPAGLALSSDVRANRAGRRFDALNEAAGVLALCLVGPAAYYAASGRLEPAAWALWLLSSAYFLGPIFYVKMAALQHRATGDPSVLPALAQARRRSTAYHAAALAAVAAWSAFGSLPAFAAVPFAVAFAKTLARGARLPERTDFRRLGYTEVAYSVLFVLVMSLISRRGLV